MIQFILFRKSFNILLQEDKILLATSLIETVEKQIERVIQLLQTISRLTLTPFLQHIRDDLLKNYDIALIYTTDLDSKPFLNRSIQYSKRTWTNLLKKLVNKQTSLETQKVLKDWIVLLKHAESKITNGPAFLKELRQWLETSSENAPVPTPTRRSRRRSTVMLTAASTQEQELVRSESKLSRSQDDCWF